MTQEKATIFSGRQQVNLFKEFIINSKENGYSLVFDKRTQEISSIDKFGNIHPIDNSDWRALCNSILQNYNTASRDGIKSKYHLPQDERMINLKEFKSLTLPESNGLRKDILEGHLNKYRPLPIYNPFLEKLRRIDTRNIDPNILNTSLWTYKNDELNAGPISLRKLIRERLLWEKGKVIPQMMDCYIFIGDPQMGKSAIGELLCDPDNVLEEHQKLEDGFNLNSYDRFSLYSKARFIEMAETTVMTKNPGLVKDFVTSTKIDSRAAGSGMKRLTAERGYVIYGTSNYKRCIAQEVAGRRFIPLELDGFNPDIADNVHGMVRWLKDNRMDMYALELKNLDNGMAPNSFGDNSPEYQEFGSRLGEYQKPYIILKSNKNESSIELLDSRLSKVGFNIKKYPVDYGVFDYLLPKERNLVNVLKESGWEKTRLSVRINGKVEKIWIWYNENEYVLSESKPREQYDYIVTRENIIKREAKHLPNDDIDPSSDGPNGGSNKPQPPSPNGNTPSIVGPNTENNNASLVDQYKEKFNHLPKIDPPTESTPIPPPNIPNEVSMGYHRFDDPDLSGGMLRKLPNGDFYITPNAPSRNEYEEYSGYSVDVIREGAIPDKLIKAAQFLFLEYDQYTKGEQWTQIKKIEKILPIHHVMFTGSKSFHIFIKLDKIMKDMKLWRQLQEGLILMCGSDPSIKNPGRLMASPLHKKVGANDYPESWKLSDDCVSIEDVKFLLEYVEIERKQKKVKVKKYDSIKDPIVVQQEIEDLWNTLPPSKPKDNNYNEYMEMAFGSSILAQENGLGIDWLISLVDNHSPLRNGDLGRCVQNADGKVGSGTFYYHYDSVVRNKR